MSFSSETKNELARIIPEKKCCMLAEISGFMRVAGSLRLVGSGKFKIVVTTENPAVARHYKTLIKTYYNIDSKLEIGESNSPGTSGYSYSLTIRPEDRSDLILRETGILLVKEGEDYISDGIYFNNLRSKCCKKAYLRGVFLGCGSITNPSKSYQMEFITSSKRFAFDLKKIITSFVDLNANIVTRHSSYVVYIKKASYISDMLAIMKAYNSMLEFQNVMINKGIRADATRMANCDNANLDRAIMSAERQLIQIRIIEEKLGLENIPKALRDLALIRKENPDVNLTEIGELLNPPIKKSGVNKRFKKLEEIANKLN
ncbi:MAG TPA: DNA-binding protein WhiA [Anaerovoracaceae bacterium]|nr:DNA-binding protein WhiA [Anaerovoracaceae bacterium]